MVQTSPLRQLTPPPLENGDRLTRDEFERRYAAMPEGYQAQLIEGIVYMSAALRFESHGEPHSDLHGWLWSYKILTPGLRIADAPTIRLDGVNEPQPDIVLLVDPASGGQARLTADDYVEGAPELIAEISASTVSIDLGSKKTAYARNGVQEYIVWRVRDRALDWFVLENGHYQDLLPDADGITRSRKFPGLWLERSALLQGDMPRVLAILQTGLATLEHQEFVDSLHQVLLTERSRSTPPLIG